MPSYVTPKKNVEYVFYISLVSQANTKIFQANPTIVAGDFKVATDDGVPGNPGTLPAVDADFTKRVKVVLAAGEMNGDNVTFIASDAAGAEWCDLTINIQTTATQIDNLVRSTTPANTLDVSATGEAGLDFNNIKDAAGAHTLTNITVPAVTTTTTATTATNLTNAPTNGDLTATMKTSVQGEVDTSLASINLDHLCKTATVGADMTAEVVDNTIISRILANGNTSAFVPSTDGLQPIRDVAPHGSAMVGTNGANTTVPDAAGIAPTAVEIRQEMDSNSTRLDADVSSRAPSGEYNTEMGRITGNVALASGVDLTHIMGTILTEGGAGRLAAAFIKLLDVVTPLLVASDVMRGTDGVSLVIPDAAGIAAALHATTNALINALNNLSSANVTTACTSSLNTYDPPTRAEATTDKNAIITEVDANETKIDALNNISVANIIAGIADGAYDLQEMMRVIFAASSGKSNGGGTNTLHFRDSGDGKNRITATVDADGNRTVITLDAS